MTRNVEKNERPQPVHTGPVETVDRTVGVTMRT